MCSNCKASPLLNCCVSRLKNDSGYPGAMPIWHCQHQPNVSTATLPYLPPTPHSTLTLYKLSGGRSDFEPWNFSWQRKTLGFPSLKRRPRMLAMLEKETYYPLSLFRLIVDVLYQEGSPFRLFRNSTVRRWTTKIRSAVGPRSLTSTPRLAGGQSERNSCNLSCIWGEEQKRFTRLCLQTSKAPSAQQWKRYASAYSHQSGMHSDLHN